MEHANKIILFQEKQIRRILIDDEWFYSVIDVIEVLTDSENPRDYWYRLKKREVESGGIQLSTICRQLKLEASDGKKYSTDCANTEGLFRIIMSVPSPKAEPFKLWLAQVGKERIDEIENPELAAERAKALYKAKGYSEDWIAMRLKSIDVRQQLTNEWKERDVKEGQEYAILTAEISKATFGLTPSEYKDHKGLKRENLRDHMTNLELIFTMLGEEVTKNLAISEDAQGLVKNQKVAREGGKLAGEARKKVEKDKRVKVVTSENFLKQIAAAKDGNFDLEAGEEKS
jgi:DNA-damage-inducible protein D